MDKTFQRGDIGPRGIVAKIVPAHWQKKGTLDTTKPYCWYKPESKWAGRRGQTVVPMNVKKFKVSI